MKQAGHGPKMRPLALILVALLLGPSAAAEGREDPVVVQALAVANTPEGLVGHVAQVSIQEEPGSGLLFMDTQPFTQVDMQGSARIAVRVAGSVTGIDVATRDVFIVVRSNSAIIGGPSAGALLTVGVIAALKDWTVDPRVYMTGTINLDGSIGPVGGVPEKAKAAADAGARLFLYPVGEEVSASRNVRGARLVNMSEHCQTLGIACQSVVDVEEAVTAFTGMRFERATVPTSQDATRYEEVMRPLAQEQVDEAQAALALAQARRANATAIPSAWARVVDERLRLATSEREAADAQWKEARWYAASSKAFASLIASREALLLLDLSLAEDRARLLADRVGTLDEEARLAQGRVKERPVRGAEEWQALGAAQERALETMGRVDLARASLARGDTLDAVEHLAYGMERAKTVEWWLTIGAHLAQGGEIPPRLMEERAVEAILEAEAFQAYVEATLGEGSQTLRGAQGSLASARGERGAGHFASALFGAIEAQVRAGLALEAAAFGQGLPAPRLERAREGATRAIHEARVAGVEPVLAASQAEIAMDLASPVDQVAYYEHSRIVAGIHKYLAQEQDAPRASRYVGSLPQAGPEEARTLVVGLAGVGLGVAASLLAFSWRQRSARATPPDNDAAGPVVSLPVQAKASPPAGEAWEEDMPPR